MEFAIMMGQYFLTGFTIGGVGMVFSGISQDWIKMVSKKKS